MRYARRSRGKLSGLELLRRAAGDASMTEVAERLASFFVTPFHIIQRVDMYLENSAGKFVKQESKLTGVTD